MNRKFKRCGLASVLILMCTSAFAYVRQFSMNNGTGVTLQIRWDQSQVTTGNGVAFKYCCSGSYAYSQNPSGSNAYGSGTEATFSSTISTAMGKWESAVSGLGLDFFATIAKTTALSSTKEWDIVNGSAQTNGENSIIWSTNLTCINTNGIAGCQCNYVDASSNFDSCYGQTLPTSVVGLTTTWFSLSTGKIIEADIQLNDKQYVFKSSGTTGDIVLPDVLTHELGHVLGLDHSLVIASTMFPTAAIGQQDLHSDDVAGIRSIYVGNSSGYGTIKGTVTESSSLLFGAQVTAVEMSGPATRLPTSASSLTNLNGQFDINGLPTGDYILFVENFKGSDYLGSYYEGNASTTGKNAGTNQLNKSLDTPSRRGFVPVSAANLNEPLLVHVSSNSTSQWVNVDVADIRTAETTDYADTLGAATTAIGSATTGLKALGGLSAGDSTDFFKFNMTNSTTAWYFRVVGQMLYATVNLDLRVWDSAGNDVTANCTTHHANLEAITSTDDNNKDAELICPSGLGTGAGGDGTTYYVEVYRAGAYTCNTTNFPLGTSSELGMCSDGKQFFAVVGGPIDGSSVPSTSSLSDSLSGAPPTGFLTSLGPVGVSLNCSEFSESLIASLWNPSFCNDSCLCLQVATERPFGPSDGRSIMIHGGLALLLFTLFLGIRRRKAGS